MSQAEQLWAEQNCVSSSSSHTLPLQVPSLLAVISVISEKGMHFMKEHTECHFSVLTVDICTEMYPAAGRPSAESWVYDCVCVCVCVGGGGVTVCICGCACTYICDVLHLVGLCTGKYMLSFFIWCVSLNKSTIIWLHCFFFLSCRKVHVFYFNSSSYVWSVKLFACFCLLPDTVFNPHMRRDFYRGSQDSLADRMEERRSAGTSLFRGEMCTDLLEVRRMFWLHCGLWPSGVLIALPFGWQTPRRNLQIIVGTVWILKKFVHEFNYRVSQLSFSQAQQLP
jgi:hypothetical protein